MDPEQNVRMYPEQNVRMYPEFSYTYFFRGFRVQQEANLNLLQEICNKTLIQ